MNFKIENLKLRGTFIRPSNATVYTAGDVISEVTNNNHFSFTQAGFNGPFRGTIEGARIISSANQSTKPELELWLFSEDIAEVADNSAFAPTDAEMLTLLGIIDFAELDWRVGNATSGADGNSCCESIAVPPIVFIVPAQTIYGQLVVRNAYTPVSGETFTVDLMVALDRTQKVG